MRTMKWLLAAGLIAAVTAACTTETGYYPSASYSRGHYNSGYNSAYNNNTGYYTSSGYYTAPGATSRRGPYGDYDRDGVPNRYDRDANGDGVSDRWQR